MRPDPRPAAPGYPFLARASWLLHPTPLGYCIPRPLSHRSHVRIPSLADVAAGVAGGYEVLIASDVAYYQPDVQPLADAMKAMGAATTLIVAPMHREAARSLAETLSEMGSSCVEHQLTLVTSDADGWLDGEGGERFPPPSSLQMPALAFCILEVSWPREEESSR